MHSNISANDMSCVFVCIESLDLDFRLNGFGFGGKIEMSMVLEMLWLDVVHTLLRFKLIHCAQ